MVSSPRDFNANRGSTRGARSPNPQCFGQGAGWVFRHRQIGLITDTETDDRWLTLLNQPYTVRSALGVPILKSGELLGILTRHRWARRRKPPNPNEPLSGEAVLINWATLEPDAENRFSAGETAPNSTRVSAPTTIVETLRMGHRCQWRCGAYSYCPYCHPPHSLDDSISLQYTLNLVVNFDFGLWLVKILVVDYYSDSHLH